MTSTLFKAGLFGLAQIVLASLAWYIIVPDKPWHIIQQFYGHIGPAIFLVSLGASAIYFARDFRALNRIEAWLAILAGGLYVLADTFIMHPPFGVFDGAGNAEQEHVSIMALIFVLGVSALVMLRKFPQGFPTGAHFLIGIAVAAMVFLGHHQHTYAGTTAHNAVLVLLGAAALFRILGKIAEYGITMIVSGFVFFSSQMGFAMYVDAGGHSGGAWVALWATLGFASATGFLALAPRDAVPAE